MSISQIMAAHLRQVHFGGNWTTSCLRDQLAGVEWKAAVKGYNGFNSIATLTCHTTYYVDVLLRVLRGGPLDSKDEYSFQLPPINSQHDWERLLDRAWQNAESAAQLVEQLPDAKLTEDFVDVKYGTYYRNIAGTIEHMHYHLGQIALIKKLISPKS
jgi:hypothetical protein